MSNNVYVVTSAMHMDIDFEGVYEDEEDAKRESARINAKYKGSGYVAGYDAVTFCRKQGGSDDG